MKRFGDRFLDRVFNREERENLKLDRVESVAGYWASKEAISKALGM